MIPLRDDNPTARKPLLAITLIAVNVLVFLYQVSLSPRAGELFVYQFGAIPAVVVGTQRLPVQVEAIPPVLSLFSSMFLHGGWMHLIGNMWYLWIFGDNIEDAMGRARFLAFYLVTGLAASAAHALSDPASQIPTIGASGAISGVLGAYFMLYPHARILVLIPLGFFTRLIYVPAVVALGFWFLFQLLSGAMSSAQGGGVAWWAHIGGFIAGMLLVGLFKRREVHYFNPRRPHYDDGDPW
jgi:membrane associated rhomboid family serine protease